MNVMQNSALASAALKSARVQSFDGREMVARVASARVHQAIEDGGDRKALFMIVGLDAQTTSTVARRIGADHPEVGIYVHPDFADDHIPAGMLSTLTIGDHRNKHRDLGRGATVFAPSRKELDDVGKTAEDIPQISQRTLVSLPELWIECAPELKNLEDRNRRNLVNVLQGLALAEICNDGVRMFGAFVQQLDVAYSNMDFERALDAALPALRIPRDAGQFKKLNARGRIPSPQTWSERFKELHELAEEALYLRRKGAPLPRPALLQRLEEMTDEKPQISDDEHKTLKALIEDRTIEPGQWRPSQDAATNMQWSTMDRLFKKARRKVQEQLGAATANLFRIKMPTTLTSEDIELLSAVNADGEAATESERDFFFKHRSDISEYSKPLLKRWEAFVFRSTEQHTDLPLGLFMAIADLVEATNPFPKEPRVLVRLHGADRQKFWDAHSQELCRFLRDRYRGLGELFEKVGVSLDFGMCWRNPWDTQNGSARPSRATVKEFRFDIFLMDAAPSGDAGERPTPEQMVKQARGTTQFVWAIPMDTVASAFRDNLAELIDLSIPDKPALIAAGRFARAQDQERSTDGRISLLRRTSFLDASGQPAAILVDQNDHKLDCGRRFETELTRLRGTILSASDADTILNAYLTFERSYTEALRALVAPDGRGLASDALVRQAGDYGALLRSLRLLAPKDECRRALWIPMLSVGIAYAEGTKPLAICTPWHPFKLAGAAVKARRLAKALSEMLSRSETADIRTFARTIEQTVGDGWHPAVGLFFTENRAFLIGETDHFADFALMEPPTSDQGAEEAFDGYSEVAGRELLAVADEYLDLQPHQRANFSVVLYNADNRSLPSFLAKELAAKVERERDLRCDLILTHSDQRRLRQIYTEQNVAISSRLDDAMASEAAQTFLSRLRVGFIDLGGFGHAESTVQAADIVFMHDVIARAARTSWRRMSAPVLGWKSFERSTPDGETRRRHFELGARKTEALLVPAERPEAVQHYLNLMRDLHLQTADEPDAHFVPVREINFDGGGVGSILKQAHSIADWVVTYDAIADAHLFKSNGVKIIRYVPRPDRDHSLVVSTYKPSSMLVLRLSEEIGRILGVGNKEAGEIARACVEKASDISGRVVLRAARLENNALELLGLVLSRQVIEQSWGEGFTPVCWLLLDDFAERLGHKGQKADILTVCLSAPDEVPTVDLMVIESKFVSRDGESAAMVESMKQMRATTKDLHDRVVGYEDALNRDTWLRRLADLVIEQGEFKGLVEGRSAQEWARLIRSNEARLRTSGLSMVFIHDRLDIAPEPLPSPGPGQDQHTFSRAQVADGLRDIQAAIPGRA